MAPAVSARLLLAASALCIVISVPAGTRLPPGTGLKRTATPEPAEASVGRREPLRVICDGKPSSKRRQRPRHAGESRATADWSFRGITPDCIFTLNFGCSPIGVLSRCELQGFSRREIPWGLYLTL